MRVREVSAAHACRSSSGWSAAPHLRDARGVRGASTGAVQAPCSRQQQARPTEQQNNNSRQLTMR